MSAWAELLDAPREQQIEALTQLIDYALHTDERWSLFSDEAIQSMIEQEADREELVARRVAPIDREQLINQLRPTYPSFDDERWNGIDDHWLGVMIEMQREAQAAEDTRPLYGDVAALLDGTMPEPPKPSILTRDDGVSVFYKSEINNIDGDPEDGKTWVALAAIVEEVNSGGRCIFVDMDHNGMHRLVDRLVRLGADPEKLRNTNHFRYVEPEDAQHLNEVVADCVPWAPGIAVYDCVGELMAQYGANNDSADEYTAIINTAVMPLVKAGAAVILIDHMAKGKDSRAYGSGGTMAKRRKLGGVAIRVQPIEKLAPGRGGRLRLIGRKDRHGAVRQHCPPMNGGGFDIGDFIIAENTETGRMQSVVVARDDRQPELAPGACGPIRDGDREFMAAAEELTEAKGEAGFTVAELAKVHFNTVEVSGPQRNAARHAVNRLESAGHLHCVHKGAKGSHDPARYVATVVD